MAASTERYNEMSFLVNYTDHTERPLIERSSVYYYSGKTHHTHTHTNTHAQTHTHTILMAKGLLNSNASVLQTIFFFDPVTEQGLAK